MVAILLQALVSVAAFALGVAALTGNRFVTGRIRMPRSLRLAWGGLASFGAIVLFASIWVPFFAFFGAILIFATALAGLAAGLFQGGGARRGAPLVALLIGAVVAGAAQPLGLKVLALPKADELPRALVAPATVLNTYRPGEGLEGIAAAPDGTLYLISNTGEDHATADYRNVQATLIARARGGGERAVFRLPKGVVGGVPVVGQDGIVYVSGHGAEVGLWRVRPDGTGALFAHLPADAWPNGVTFGPDGQLYAADSSLGVIWRIDPATGEAGEAFRGDALLARPYIALPPGANGVQFFGRDLFVSVSDSAQLLKLRLGRDGRLGQPKLVAKGIPGDDFAIDDMGTVYVTTHIYNTVVRVEPDGRRTVIADATSGVTGATDCAFGVTAGDKGVLYVVTDGGALASGDATARGTLVALPIARH